MKLITFRSQLEEEIRRLDSVLNPPRPGALVLHLPRCDHDQMLMRHLEALRSLDPVTATPESVAEAIGTNGVCVFRRRCNECNKPSDVVVQVGEEPNYESSTASLCPTCLRRALALVDSLAKAD